MPRILLLLALLAPVACANPIPMPSRRDSGAPIPTKEQPGIEIEMLSEEVSLTLVRLPAATPKHEFDNPPTARLDVSGVYRFKNHGEKTTLEIAFPCKAEPEGKSVSISVAGREAKARAWGEKDGETTPWGGWSMESWMAWSAEFAGKAETEMTVRYSIILCDEREAGYVVRSGAPWKGKIGKAAISLKLAEGFTQDHLRRLTPQKQLAEKEGVFTWSFADFEPDEDHDITFKFSLAAWDDEIAEMAKAAKGWRGKLMLAHRLSYPAPGAKPLAECAPGRVEALLAALEALVPKYTASGGTVVYIDETPVPKDGEHEDERHERYDELFEEIVEVTIGVAERLPGNKRARAVLESLVVLMKADEGSTLYENVADDDHSGNLHCDSTAWLKAAANVLAGKKRDAE